MSARAPLSVYAASLMYRLSRVSQSRSADSRLPPPRTSPHGGWGARQQMGDASRTLLRGPGGGGRRRGSWCGLTALLRVFGPWLLLFFERFDTQCRHNSQPFPCGFIGQPNKLVKPGWFVVRAVFVQLYDKVYMNWQTLRHFPYLGTLTVHRDRESMRGLLQ